MDLDDNDRTNVSSNASFDDYLNNSQSYLSNMSRNRNRNDSTNESRLSQAEKDRYLANFKRKNEAYMNKSLFRP